MGGGAWWAAVYGVAQSRTRPKRLSSSIFLLKKKKKGKHSLAVQWLGLCDFTAGDAGLIPV